MANLTETATYDAAVPQLETTTLAAGGASGAMNSQAQALANRTKYLKAERDKETAAGRAIVEAVDVAAQRTLLNVENGADVTDEANVTAIEAATAEVTSAPSHLNVLVAGAKKRLTWSGFIALIKSLFGFVANPVGFEMAGGTTSKKLTVDADANTSNIPTSAGKTDANAIAATTGATLAARLAAATAAATTSAQGAVVLTATPADVTTGTDATKALTCAALKTSTPQLSGIAFPATQVPSADANTLDDYEEGSATLAVKGSSTAGTYEITAQTTRYTKKGREVTLVFDISLAASITGGGSGTLIFDGLPYPLASGVQIGGNISTSYVTFTGKYLSPVYSSTSRFMLYNIVSGGASGFLDISAVAGSARFLGSITYIV